MFTAIKLASHRGRLPLALLLWLCLLPWAPETGVSQPSDLRFDRMTTLEGLSQDIVRCIHRDRIGFLWIGTEDGLNRYDGYSMKVYKHDPADSSTIVSNWIMGICEYEEEGLLVMTPKGVSVYRRSTDSFTSLPAGSALPGKGSYHQVLRDGSGDYWFVDDAGAVLSSSPDFTRVSVMKPPAEGIPSPAKCLFLDSAGRMIVGGTGQIRIYSGSAGHAGGPIVRKLADPELPVDQEIIVNRIAEERPGIFWLATNWGLYRFTERTETLECVSLGEVAAPKTRGIAFDLAWDSRGRLWVAGFEGLYCHDHRKRRTTQYPVLQGNPLASASRVYSLYVDPAGVLWAGTWSEGIYKTNLQKEQFGLLRHTARTPFAGRSSSISAIYEDPDGSLWLGDQNHGVTIFDRSMNSVVSPVKLSGTDVTAIAGDGRTNVWIASRKGVLDWYDARTNSVRQLRMPPTPDALQTIFALAHDPAGFLWIGTEAHGVYRIDLQREARATQPAQAIMEPFGPSSKDSAYHRITSAWSFYLDHDRDLWIGGWVGNGALHRITGRTLELESYSHPALSNARSISGDGGNGLWVGTWGNGLTRFVPRTGEMRTYTERDGLPSNYVKSILQDDRGRLWIAGEKGLSRFDPATEEFRNYDVSDGLQGNFFFSGSCAKGSDGRLWFGGPDGVNGFFPDSIHDPAYAAPVALTGFRVFDRTMSLRPSPGLIGDVELSHDENYLSFEYVSFDYRAPLRQSYAYLMEGIDEDWVQAGARRNVSYAHLDPGEYAFKVKSANSDGRWTQVPATMRIVIFPAFWQTWWFRGASALALIGLVYGGYRYRLNKLLEVERTRSTIATDLHDDIGTSLTNIALFSDLARRDLARGSDETAGRLEKISETSRSLLDSMNDIVWAIKPENDALEQTVLRMEDYAVELLQENGIELTVKIPESARGLKLSMAARRNLFLIFKEAIGNVLKHSGASHVDVTLSTIGNGARRQQLQLVISDNGRGFDASTQKHGNGLGNMKTRARHLSGTLSLDSEPGKGTRIAVDLPMKSPR